MDQLLAIADIIWRIGGALVIVLIVILLLYLIRLVFMAKGIVGGVKKTVDSAQQTILSPLGMISSFFGPIEEDEFDDDEVV